jgi:CubicO group peptidase (beta-lactamase class C family)
MNRSHLRSVALLLLVHAFASAQTRQEAARKVDSLFASYNSRTPGAAVAIVKDGEVILKKGYGMADLSHDISITPQTVFNIASVSKQFTAFAIYLLESEGKLSFEDDVRKYIPEVPDYGAVIKVRHLLAHTSGLRDQAAMTAVAGWQPGDVQTTEQIIRLVAKQKALNFTPGSAFNYSNTGYTLLAEIVRRITGTPFAAYAESKIFAPLGMRSTRVQDSYDEIVKNAADSYERVNSTYYRRPLNAANAGPSNVLTTVEDLSKWVLNFEKPTVGTRQLIAAFNEPSYLDNGAKVVLRVVDGDTIFHAKGQNVSNYKGVRHMSHGGHAAGFRTYMGRFPDQHFAVIALSNDEHNENLRARWQIADFYIKQSLREEARPNAPSLPTASVSRPASYASNIRDFEGDYYSDELSTRYTFRVQENALVMTHTRLSDLELQRTGENGFSGSGAQTFAFTMEFLRGADGAVTGFVLSNFGVKNLAFAKLLR